MRVLLGTANPSKVKRFRRLLEGYNVTFLTLQDLGIIREPSETGRTPEENARRKAAFYGQFADYVICNDSGLYLDALPLDDPRQPGLHIRSPQGKRLDDEEMIAYYARLVHTLGGRVLAYYLDGFAVSKQGKICSFMENSEAARCSAFYLVDRPSDRRHPGWPLDSISLNRSTQAYFVEAGDNKCSPEEEQIILGAYRRRLVRFLAEALGLHDSVEKSAETEG